MYLDMIRKKNGIRTMFFIMNNSNPNSPHIIDAFETWTDACYNGRILSRNFPHMSISIERL
jgi:hypothetical protein